MLDWLRERGPCEFGEAPLEPVGAAFGVGGDDDLVDGRDVNRVADGKKRVGVANTPLGDDALLAQALEAERERRAWASAVAWASSVIQ